MQPGDRVNYLGIKAAITHIRKNGIWISFWGRGLKKGQLISRRVSAKDIKPA